MSHTRLHTILSASLSMLLPPGVAHAAPAISSVSPSPVDIGAGVTVTGTVTPAAAGEQVQLQHRIDGVWTSAGAVAATDATGAWSTTYAAQRGGALRAVQLTGSGGTSSTSEFLVRPSAFIGSLTSRSRIYPFLGARVRWRVAPASLPDGAVRVQLTLDRHSIGYVQARIRDGVVSALVPTRGVGTFRARLLVPAHAGFTAASSPWMRFNVRAARVGPGSGSQWNRALRAGLRFRGFRVPGGTSFSSHMGDAVVAFHKAYQRERTTTFEASDWARLTRRKVRPRYTSAGTHIEIDKGRQILMQVRDGVPVFIIHVSTGATGNTPAGHHQILWKGNWVPSNYGSTLYKSMAFRGGYAIHGFPSVPTYPASHGCVRVPMWIAASLYERSPVGMDVFVYEGPGLTTASYGRTHHAADLPELAGVDPGPWASQRVSTTRGARPSEVPSLSRP